MKNHTISSAVLAGFGAIVLLGSPSLAQDLDLDAATAALHASVNDAVDHKALGDAAFLRGEEADAFAHWRSGIESGNDWAAFALGRALVGPDRSSSDLDEGIAILSAASEASTDVMRWAGKPLGDALTARNGPQDRAAAIEAYAAASRLGNVWAMPPLARSVVSGEADLEIVELEALLTGAVTTDDEFAPFGTRVLAEVLTHDGRLDEARSILAPLANGVGEQAVEAATDIAFLDEADDATFAALAEDGSARAAREMFDRSPTRTDRQRVAAAAWLERAAELDPALVAAVHHRAGDVLLSAESPKVRLEAFAHFEKAAEAGNTWSSARLASLWRWGRDVRTDAVKSREFAMQAVDGGNVQAGIPALMNLYGTSEALEVEEIERIIASALRTSDADVVAEGISWASANARVEIAQHVWNRTGLYDGNVSGVMDTRTYRAFERACAQDGLAGCRMGIMPADMMLTIVEAIGEQS